MKTVKHVCPLKLFSPGVAVVDVKPLFMKLTPSAPARRYPYPLFITFLLRVTGIRKQSLVANEKLKVFVFTRRLSTRREESLRALSKSEIN